ncbi:hypothetical protein GCM10011514_09770 [Emticicia aquatilis]|uniref:AP2/ERF domain-containing protein n=1 Tax=Emticicia aquatilis TaxID=1537369 RepID=A0A916YJN4_9BACT|nr:hypothetical protein [Emticicia aquatilis]GGD47842.1 hypothetical protein GCM10011514_09770 [Emticicia aquatilis]
MKKIQLKNGLEVLVDDDIYGEVVNHKWNICTVKGKRYVRTTIYFPKKQDIYLHHIVLGGLMKGYTALFVDGNSLNCQKENLIQVPFHTKSHIRPCHFTNKTSKYRGVYVSRGMYISSIQMGGKFNYLGTFISEKEAAIKYDLKAIELYKQFAITNIITNPYFVL